MSLYNFQRILRTPSYYCVAFLFLILINVTPLNAQCTIVFTPGISEPDYLGADFMSCTSVNNSGIAIGNKEPYSGSESAIRWDSTGAKAVELGYLGKVLIGNQNYNCPYAINDTGTVVGFSNKFDNSGNYLGFQAVKWESSNTTATELAGLGVNVNNQSSNYAYAINNAGVAVGQVEKYDISGNYFGTRAVKWGTSGTLTELGNLGTDSNQSTYASAAAINDYGVIVGAAKKFDSSGNDLGFRAVRWDATGTVPTELGNLGTTGGWTDSSACAVNAMGTVLGTSYKWGQYGSLGPFAVRWDAGSTIATELGHLGTDINGSTTCDPRAINATGTAVGSIYKFDSSGKNLGYRAVRWDASTTIATELGNLGTYNGQTDSYADAINAAGMTVGSAMSYSDLNDLCMHAVAWGADGTAIDLNSLIDPKSGWILTNANSISDTGWIVGSCARTSNGNGQGFFLMQIPEPSVWILLFSGIFTVCLIFRRYLQRS
jgi:hypothetical protein